MAEENSNSDCSGNSTDSTIETTEAFYIDKFDISSASDEKHSVVCAFEVMPEGCLLVCDDANKKVKLLDADSEVLSEMVLTSEPHGMVVFNDSDIIVSLPSEKCLQKLSIDIDNNISLQNKRKTRVRCNKLIKFDKHIITHAFDDSHRYFNVIDSDGHEVRCILKEARNSNGIFGKIRFLCLSKDRHVLYVTDDVCGCIGMSLNGEILFRAKIGGTPNHWGVCTDSLGFLYVASYDTDKIEMLNNKGEKTKSLIYVKGMKPCCIAYNERERRLFVKRGSTNLILVFQMEY